MNVEHAGEETLNDRPAKYDAKKSPKLGAAMAALPKSPRLAAVMATSGLGGTNSVESLRANLFISG